MQEYAREAIPAYYPSLIYGLSRDIALIRRSEVGQSIARRLARIVFLKKIRERLIARRAQIEEQRRAIPVASPLLLAGAGAGVGAVAGYLYGVSPWVGGAWGIPAGLLAWLLHKYGVDVYNALSGRYEGAQIPPHVLAEIRASSERETFVPEGDERKAPLV